MSSQDRSDSFDRVFNRFSKKGSLEEWSHGRVTFRPKRFSALFMYAGIAPQRNVLGAWNKVTFTKLIIPAPSILPTCYYRVSGP